MANKKSIHIVSLWLLFLFLPGMSGISAGNTSVELTLICREDLSELASSFMRGFLTERPELKAAVKTFKDEKALAAFRKELPGALIIKDNIGDDGKFSVPGGDFRMLALQGLAFIVNGANPVESMSQDKIRSLLVGKIIGWKELGGTDTLVNIYVYEKSDDFSVRILKAVFPGLEKFTEKALTVPDIENMKFVVSADRDAFGFISFSGPQMQPELRILKVDGAAPSFSGMAVRKYPFSRTVYISMPEKPSSDAKKFFEFITGREGRAVIARNKMFPLIR